MTEEQIATSKVRAVFGIPYSDLFCNLELTMAPLTSNLHCPAHLIRAGRVSVFHVAFFLSVCALFPAGCSQEAGNGALSCFETSECGPNQSCSATVCVCDEGFANCDGDMSNGCETQGECLCPEMGLTQSCYDGPDSTAGVGQCRPGERTCLLTGWSDCARQVLPQAESCESDGVDNDCNGSMYLAVFNASDFRLTDISFSQF